MRGPEIIWKDVETSAGVYDWTKINNAVTEIQNAKTVANGVSVIVVVRGTPSFYQANPPFSCGPIKPANYGALGTFMFNLIDELETDRGHQLCQGLGDLERAGYPARQRQRS